MKFSMEHACISVTDLERSIKLYNKALGLKVIKRTDDDEGEFRLAYLGTLDRLWHNEDICEEDALRRPACGRCLLEVIWNRDKKGEYDLGDNEIHIGFRTDDYEASVAFHKKMGCFHHENKKYRLYFITDPDGYLIEILG